MKAILCRAYGLPNTLTLEDIPSPAPGPGQVLIRVKACSLNFPDTLTIQNKYQFKPPLPFSPGSEASGLVQTVGEGVTHLQPGDRVFTFGSHGGLADELVADARVTVPIPDAMDFVTGASTMYAYGTSYHALKDRAQLKPGETLLVLGAAGGVGLAAVELGKLMGATVIAAASTDEKLAVCREKGAAHLINYSTDDLRERLKELTGGNGVDVVYDPVGDKFAEPAIRSLAWKGRYLVVGFAGGDIPKIPLNLALLKGSALVGVFWGMFTQKEPALSRKNMQEIATWAMQGTISPHIHNLYSLAEAPRALTEMMNREVVGKAVVVMSADAAMPQKVVTATATTTPRREGNTLLFDNIAHLKTFTGRELGTSDWLPVTQAMINDFAKATGDYQWIHVDTEKAKTNLPGGTTVAHGFLTLSLSPRFSYGLYSVTSTKMALNYGTDKVRFISPVPSGSRVRMRAVLTAVEDMPGGAKVRIEATFEIDGQTKLACVAELISVIYE
ncbi:MAG: zinc-binding dehydrogenase [Bacteroidetes bacterium]|nr:zinc-binding dehydrogenase [Fibrella sp.]